jgi:outer membrane protein OmpA-like peptidoglycan-associated protein
VQPPGIQAYPLIVRNNCSDTIQVRLIYQTALGYETGGGGYWTVAGGTSTHPLAQGGRVIELVSNEVYAHVTGPQGAWEIGDSAPRDFNGTQLPMARVVASRAWGDSTYSITFACPGPARPASPTAQPPAIFAGPYVIFFDWGSDAVTPAAAAILDNAAAGYLQTGGNSRVVIAAHTDRSGTAEDNIRLSQREANNVRAYLVGKGVPDGAITTEAYGESRPLVETADGVREIQNRRVEITFGPGEGW